MKLESPAIRRFSPGKSQRPLVSPIINALRKTAWKMFGLHQAFEQQADTMDRQILQLQELQGSFQLRPGTVDWWIVQEVIYRNEYRLPTSFHADDILVDVGMHIGTFCLAALMRGACHVHGFEAEMANYTIATTNLSRFGDRVQTHHKAIWRSDRKGDKLFHEGATSRNVRGNTGGGCILYPTEGEALDVVAFDDVIREVTANGRQRVKLLKIDCEGSEFPILLTSRTLHLIDNIHGEFHEIGPGTCNPGPGIPDVARVQGVESFTVDALARCLENAGFSFSWMRHGDSFHGLFFANRQA